MKTDHTQQIKTPVKLPVTLELDGGFWWLSSDGLLIAKLYYIERQQTEPQWIVHALNNFTTIEQELLTLRNAFQKEREICKQAEQSCFENTQKLVLAEQENQRLREALSHVKFCQVCADDWDNCEKRIGILGQP